MANPTYQDNNQSQDYGAIPVRVAISGIPTPPVAPPATLAASGTWNSGIISASGFNAIAATAQLTQAGSLTINRFIDPAGTIPITFGGSQPSQVMTANVLATLAINDGLPFSSFNVVVVNTSGSTGTLSNVFILEKSA